MRTDPSCFVMDFYPFGFTSLMKPEFINNTEKGIEASANGVNTSSIVYASFFSAKEEFVRFGFQI
jgi:hypothetical protein